MSNQPHIVILGGGPAGLGAAYQITKRKFASVSVIEREENIGGIAGSFKISGINVDYGSHRLHPACDPEILKDLRILLDGDLIVRPRHGRIRLHNRWLHFPLKPIDLALKLPFSFSINTVFDLIRKSLQVEKNKTDKESFATVLEDGLGRTICREFYFPYVQKIWGLAPEEISPIQAYRRISASSMKKIFQKVLSAVPGLKGSSRGIYYYPRRGFGQICNDLYNAAKDSGADFHLGTQVLSIKVNGSAIQSICTLDSDDQVTTYRPVHVWSTIPISILVRLFRPSVPQSVIEASQNIQYRSMILIYLVLEQSRFSEYDAHYFPDSGIPITRISEPKHYSGAQEPRNLTVLCAELPCSTNSPEWNMADAELGDTVRDSLKRASIPITTAVKHVVSRRIAHAYPIYHKDYEIDFDCVNHQLSGVQNLVSFGRQGLFSHDNIHHALYMAYAAVNCLNDKGHFDRDKWRDYHQHIFPTFIVED